MRTGEPQPRERPHERVEHAAPETSSVWTAHPPAILAAMSYAIFRQRQLDWEQRDDGSGRAVSRLSDAMTQSRADTWRDPVYGTPPEQAGADVFDDVP